MRKTEKYIFLKVFFLLCFFYLYGCTARGEETPVIPPVTSPLSSEYIGFGVIKDSFTHITADPLEDSLSYGYLRRGSLVKIVSRQVIGTTGNFVSWVLVDGPPDGWLKEEVMDIYSSEGQARTASESMSR